MDIRFYDERYYLSVLGIYERKMIELWKEKNNELTRDEISTYSSLISDYNSYINVASKLISELSIKGNSISIASLISVLIHCGIFSYDDFVRDNCDDLLRSKIGINVLNGIGCCRNVSNFVTDIFNAMNEPCENLTVVLSDKSDKEKAITSMANHMINLIHYKEVPYGFDALSNLGSLYYFINGFEILPINPDEESYMYYKPYIEMVYENKSLKDIRRKLNHFKDNGRKGISQEEFISIVTETDIRLQENMGLVKDFIRDTKEQIESINEKIKKLELRSN